MTAVTPRRPLLISIPLLLAVALLTAAAARTPTVQPPSLERHAAARTLPRLASPESLPVISVTWDNAPLEDVIAAFAKFAHRQITAAPGVGGLVTATVIKQPWRQALESIMARQGLRVDFRPDSSVYISPLHEAEPRPRQGDRRAQLSRGVSGTVEDAQTGAPISNAHINVAGVQLIGAPNEAWTDDRGRFSLRVTDGEVWLDASASCYEFQRVTLAPTDSVANFHGHKTGQVANTRGSPVLVIDGVVVDGSKSQGHTCDSPPNTSPHYMIRIF